MMLRIAIVIGGRTRYIQQSNIKTNEEIRFRYSNSNIVPIVIILLSNIFAAAGNIIWNPYLFAVAQIPFTKVHKSEDNDI